MYLIFMLVYIAFLIVQLINLFMAAKSNDNNYWFKFFGTTICSIISSILIVMYENFYSKSTDDGIIVIFISAIALLVYGLILGIGILLKIIKIFNLKYKGVIIKKENKKINKKVLFKPIIIVFLISIGICSIDFLAYSYMEKIENKRYDAVKKEKLVDMVNYINNKYDANYTVKDNIFYREYKYSSVEISEKKHNDFYIGMFDNDGKTITVSVNKDNFFSDNAQIEEIGYLIRDYYSNIVGIDIDYVEIRNENGYCKDDLINETLQFKFNEIVTKDNIETFIDELLKNNVEMIFYVKNVKNRKSLLTKLINKLTYLEDNNNIKSLSIYLYNSEEELIIEKQNISLRGDDKYDNIHLKYNSSHMFGFIYIPNDIEFSDEFGKENSFVTIAFSNKKYSNKNKYKDKDTYNINDWTIYDFK